MDNATQTTLRLVLIDDDPTFNAVMLKLAAKHRIRLDAFTSLLEVGAVGRLADYDLAIVDYNLEQMSGVEIGEYLSALFAETPMLLISASPDVPKTAKWPRSIRQFVSKKAGYQVVLAEALALAAGSGRARPPPRMV